MACYATTMTHTSPPTGMPMRVKQRPIRRRFTGGDNRGIAQEARARLETNLVESSRGLIDTTCTNLLHQRCVTQQRLHETYPRRELTLLTTSSRTRVLHTLLEGNGSDKARQIRIIDPGIGKTERESWNVRVRATLEQLRRIRRRPSLFCGAIHQACRSPQVTRNRIPTVLYGTGIIR